LAGATAAALVVQVVRPVPLLTAVVWGSVVAAAGLTSCGPWSVSYAEARAVVDRRCIECHSAKPTSRAFPVAPQAVMLDTALQMQQYAPRIEATVAVERTMPLANMTGMTDKERRVLGRWVETGAKVP
jgi:uncharacterized membrane protein